MIEKRTDNKSSGYVIYCDESCHELTISHKFMSIGGIKVKRELKGEVTNELRSLMKEQQLNSEVKWSKVSSKRLEDYKRIVDFFFDKPDLKFRALIVNQSKIDLDQYHGKDRELAFYKFYYELLEKWLIPGFEYLILLDYKSNRGADRYSTLKLYLERHMCGRAWIHDLTTIKSKETPLAQLCDLLVGAVAASCNGTNRNSAKEKISSHIAHKANLSTLCTSTPLTEEKFNIFKMDLR